MARYSDRDIPDMSYDWSNDPMYNAPFSGRSVQSFIKRTFNDKARTGYFDSEHMKLYLFKDDTDKAEFEDDPTKENLAVGVINMSFDKTQYRVRVTPIGGTTINASIDQDEILLKMDMQSETKTLDEDVWTPTGDDISVKVYADINNTGVYEEISALQREVLGSVGHLELDIKPYLPVGSSRFRLIFTDKQNPAITSSTVWNVTLTEMYIESADNTWYKALVETGNNDNYRIGGFKIVGTIPKTIHIELSTSSTLAAYYEEELGVNEYTITSYKFNRARGLNLLAPLSGEGTPLPALTTGIYNVRVWLTSGAVTTEDAAITYSIMYVAPGDENNALVVMNNAGNVVSNYDESAHLCDYAVYNGGSEYGRPIFTITPSIDATPGQPDIFQLQVTAGEINELNYKIELYTNGNITIKYRIDMANNYQERSSIVDNTETFPATPGAAFYLNTSVRSNGDDDRESVYNTASTKTKLNSASWQKMSWVDGVDGWTVDDEGRRCLMLPARSRLTLPASSFTFMPGGTTTYELCYKVKNVSDYNENVISIGVNPTLPAFRGIRIKPTNITVHSNADNTDGNDIYRGTNIDDEETIHLLVSIQYSYNTLGEDYNLVTGYINGCKNFQFSFDSMTGWADPLASVVFGSDTADLYLYMFRMYNSIAVIESSAESNWINSLETREEKVNSKNRINSVLKSSTRNIDYNKIKNEGKYNFFVIEMVSGSSRVPSKSYPEGGRANIEMHYGMDDNGNSRSDWDWKIYDVETKGQGTTSMGYWLWNIRCRIDKTIKNVSTRPVAYYDTPIINSSGDKEFVELPSEERSTVWFDGVNNHPAVKRITAKINYASSMQSHKMGATTAYNVLHDNILDGALLNAAQRTAQSQDLPMPTVAVYQYPAFGFEKIVSNGIPYYTFIGLFTIGPDKGDKPTFGYNLVNKNDLITLEGVDHGPALTRFVVPWDEEVIYTSTSDKDCLSVKSRNYDVTGAFEEALEVTNAGAADTGTPEAAMPVLVDKFKDAYEVIYNNSTLIFPIALNDPVWGGQNAQTILANINSHIDDFQGIYYEYEDTGRRLSYGNMEFWIEGEYYLYHYELESGTYVSGKKQGGTYSNPLDLRVDTGITDGMLAGHTLTEQNEMFRQARRDRFIANAPTYWSMNELAFNYTFLVIFQATDNFAKNQYPQYMGAQDKWRFRQDDLDTIMDIDNNGGQTKSSYLEFDDYVGDYLYFAGSQSVLWNLVDETMWGDFSVDGQSYYGIYTIGSSIIETMYNLAHGSNYYEGFINFFNKYFWGKAQEYFPQSSYNIDANIKYEDAWINYAGAPVPPLQQSLGDHYAAEKLWVKRRALYCMSLFGVGPFGSYEDTYLGTIAFRPMSLTSLTVTVAQPMYPGLFVGTNILSTSRTLAGHEHIFTTPSTQGEEVFYLMATDNLTSIGNLKGLQISPQDSYTFTLSGKRLRDITIGGESEVTTNIRILTIAGSGELPCLETVDVRNAENLGGNLNLSRCKRLREVLAEGTQLTGIILPRGSKVETLHLPDSVTNVSYQTVPFLNDLRLPQDKTGIQLLYLEGCDLLNELSTLRDIYYSNGQSLNYIKLLWKGEKTATGADINMLAHIMQQLDKDGEVHTYYGVNDSGTGQIGVPPYMDGRLVAGKHYADDITILANGGTPVESETHPGMKEFKASYFGGNLYIVYPDNPAYEYIRFEDNNTLNVLLSNNIGDGTGITVAEAAEVTSLGELFYNNDDITSFDELKYFTGLTSLPRNAFNDADSLVSISIPANITYFDQYSFNNNDSLATMTFYGHVTTAGNNFQGMSALSRINIPSIAEWMSCSWHNNGNGPCDAAAPDGIHLYLNESNIEETDIRVPNNIYQINGAAFAQCKGITSIDLNQVNSIGVKAFYNCTGLTSLTIPSSVTTIGESAFAGCNGLTGTIIIPSTLISIGWYAFSVGNNITNLYCYKDSINTNIFRGGSSSNANIGNGQGVFYCKNVTAPSRENALKFEHIIIDGDFTYTYPNYFLRNASCKTLRIYGDCHMNSDQTNYLTYDTNWKMIEILGRFIDENDLDARICPSNKIPQNAIVHLGYNGIAATPDNVNASSSNIAVIYVGDGINDDSVLATYLADFEWSTYANKLAKWSDYNGPYKTPPVIPAEQQS